MEVECVDDVGKFTARATWPSIDDAQTAWSIEVSADGSFDARETAAINPAAHHFVAFPSRYVGRLSALGTLDVGEVREPEPGKALSPKFKLASPSNLGKPGTASSSSAAAVVPTTEEVRGVLTLQVPFVARITGSSAEIEWNGSGVPVAARVVAGTRQLEHTATPPKVLVPAQIDLDNSTTIKLTK